MNAPRLCTGTDNLDFFEALMIDFRSRLIASLRIPSRERVGAHVGSLPFPRMELASSLAGMVSSAGFNSHPASPGSFHDRSGESGRVTGKK
jgi:hypothetical protein